MSSQPQTSDSLATGAKPEREKISAFIVCCNEEDEIEDCLASVAFCDEVVVIDSFSTDRTVELCEKAGARVIQRAWPGYKEQKAFGLASSTHRWALNLDADERVSPQLRRSMEQVLERDFQLLQGNERAGEVCDGYEVNRVVYYLGRWWRRGGWYPEYRVRFFKRDKVIWGGVDPHEKPIVQGTIGRLDGELQHFTYRNMDEQFRRLHQHASVAAQEDFKRGKRGRLILILFNPWLRWFKFYVAKRGYREGMAGFLIAVSEAYYTFMKYARLWEIEHYPPEKQVRPKLDEQ